MSLIEQDDLKTALQELLSESTVRFLLRHGTAAEWTAANPILALGEPGFETDTKKEKRGDGITAWNDLDYQIDFTNYVSSLFSQSFTDPQKIQARENIGVGDAGVFTVNGATPDGAGDLNVSGVLSPASSEQTVATGNKPTKYGVVIPIGTSGFDSTLTEGLTVSVCPENGRLAGVYAGYVGTGGSQVASIGLAWSDDGLVWTKAGQLLAGTGTAGDPDQNGCTGPVIVFNPDDNLYYLFYIGLPAAGYESPAGSKTLCVATTPSLITLSWTRHGVMLNPSGATSGASEWRGANVWHPSIVRVNGMWHCFVNATNSTSKEQIGYATASTLLGPWTFDDTHSPLITIRTGDTNAGDPCVTKIPGGWRMDFYRSGAWGAADYYAVTTDALFPLGWVAQSDANPDLAATNTRWTIKSGAAGTIDSLYAHKPFIFRYAGRLFHYYTAVDTNNNRVCAVAVDPAILPSLVNAQAITGATSAARVSSIIAMLNAMGVPLNLLPIAADTFHRADGAMGNTDTGSFAWTAGGGTGWTISSNAAHWAGTTDGQTVVNSGIYDNYDLEVTISSLSAGQYPFGLIVRGSSATSFLKLYIDQTGLHWYLTDGTTTNNLVAPATLKTGDVVRVRVQGTAITLFVNNVQVTGQFTFTTHNTINDTYQGILGAANNALSISAPGFAQAFKVTAL